jgi:Zn-finger nucleic acid-binding protein
MNCPVCHKSLSPVREAFIPYQLCPECLGIWVDAKLLVTLAARRAVEEGIKPDKRVDLKPRTVEADPQPGRVRMCPGCGLAMKRFNYAYDSNIYLDRCKACDGLWLDGDEIGQIAGHIQVDPDVMITGKGVLDLQGAANREEEEKNPYADALNWIAEFLRPIL